MHIRPFFWCLLAFVCVGVLLFAANNRTHAPAILQVHADQQQVHADQQRITAAGLTTLELQLTDSQGVPIEAARVVPDAHMTNMDMEANYSDVSPIGRGQYKAVRLL